VSSERCNQRRSWGITSHKIPNTRRAHLDPNLMTLPQAVHSGLLSGQLINLTHCACVGTICLIRYEVEFKNGVRAAAVVTGRGASYEFEVIGTEGSIRCWHQLGSETVGSGWAGVRLVRHGAEGMDSYLFEEGELEAASVSDRGGQTVFCLEELVRIIDLMKPQLMAELR
jgi:predicted dehydrogenase